MEIPWDGTGINCYGMGWDGMGQKNMSHGQACETAYDRILKDKLWAVLLQYGIVGQLLTAIKSLYSVRAFRGLCSC